MQCNSRSSSGLHVWQQLIEKGKNMLHAGFELACEVKCLPASRPSLEARTSPAPSLSGSWERQLDKGQDSRSGRAA